MRRSRKPQPIFMLVLGCIALAIGAGLIIYQWNIIKKYPRVPDRLAIDAIPVWLNSPSVSAWVTITGGKWDCQGIRVYSDSQSHNTDILYQSRGPVVVLATFNREMTCADFQNQPATGVLRAMSSQQLAAARVKNADLAGVSDSKQVVSLCGYCGPNNDQTGLLIGASIFVLGLVLMNVAYQDALKIKFQRKKGLL